ncbi:MYB family transcription factor [Musa troglodytarum]|uniref:MYB family transcription factor n=1 Tax=Musa troglodytarum TaxID=320322 RepID=A0A9E7FRM5_9LILI|nr:MYB family transcription factor [Musa troglodytarum]
MENARRFQELIDALDEERRKVEVFHRELPLCLRLINQTIESYRQQLMVTDLTLSHEVAEKGWISLRPSSMSSEVSGSKQQHPWPRMATKSWGDSKSSDKEEDAAAPINGPAGGEGDDNGGTDGEKKEKFRHRRRKMRRYWTEDLHERFLHALEQLGGCHAATPKQIRKLMKVDELTSDEIKSHLQVSSI